MSRLILGWFVAVAIATVFVCDSLKAQTTVPAAPASQSSGPNTVRTVEDIESALDRLLTDSEPYEIDRQTLASLGSSHFHPGRIVQNLPAQAVEFCAEITRRYAEQAVLEARYAAEAAVADIRERR